MPQATQRLNGYSFVLTHVISIIYPSSSCRKASPFFDNTMRHLLLMFGSVRLPAKNSADLSGRAGLLHRTATMIFYLSVDVKDWPARAPARIGGASDREHPATRAPSNRNGIIFQLNNISIWDPALHCQVYGFCFLFPHPCITCSFLSISLPNVNRPRIDMHNSRTSWVNARITLVTLVTLARALRAPAP